MTDDSAASKGLGGRVGARVASYLTNAHIANKQASIGLTAQTGALIWKQFFDGTGAELRNTMGDTFRLLAEHPATDPSVKPILKFLSRGQGEMASFIGGSITGSVISGGIGDLITNLLAPAIHGIIATQPHNILTPTDVANAQVRGIGIGQDYATEAAQSGLNSDRYNALVRLNTVRPDVSIILELLNRGEISEGSARGALIQLGYASEDLDGILATRRTLIDPARLADLVTFGVLSEEDATPMAVVTGISAADFHTLVLGNGTPPDNQSLAFAYRRGVIDKDRFIRGLTQGSLRNEWIPYVEQMVLTPMSTSDAVESVVQSELTDDQGRTIARQNGLIPEHWDPLVAIAGNPPGVQEMISMWHRGILTREQLVKGIQESRLKNKYIEAVISSGETLPPERTIVSLVSKGSLTPERGMDLLLKRGYAQDIAQALLDEAQANKTVKQRDLTASQIVTLYLDRAIDETAALSMLATIGYDADVAKWELSIADLQRVKKFNDAAIARLHSQYVAFRIDANTVSSTMDSLGIAPGERDDLLALWDIELNVSTKQLTLAQIESAWKKHAIGDQELHDRIRGIGYSEDDTIILMIVLGALTPPSTQEGQ